VKILLSILCLFVGFSSVAEAKDAPVQITKNGTKVNVTIAGKPFTTYHTGGDLPKPFARRGWNDHHPLTGRP